MKAWAAKRLDEIEKLNLDGFVLKARSPSCGLRVEVFDADGRPRAFAAGLFARALAERFGDLPLSEDEPLRDPQAWKGFLARVTSRRDGPRR